MQDKNENGREITEEGLEKETWFKNNRTCPGNRGMVQRKRLRGNGTIPGKWK